MGPLAGWLSGAVLVRAMLAGVLLLSACGGDGSDGADDLSLEDSPISRTLGINFRASAESQEQFPQQQRTAEERIVVCMAAEGFEYIPQTQSFEALGDPFGEALQLGPRDFAAQFGWGMVTVSAFVQAYDSGVDPNWDYANSLTDSERDKYYLELYGEQPDINLSTSTEDEVTEAFENFEPTGCSNAAYEQAFRGKNSVFGIYEELGDIFEDMEERIQSDLRVVEFNLNWQRCVGASGYDYSSQEDAMQALSQRAQELNPGKIDRELEADIKAEEVAFALVSLDCGLPPPPLGPHQVALQVRYELEQNVVDENREIFERYGELGS